MRRGHLMVEALCALALAGVLIVACASVIRTTRRVTAAAESRARAERTGTEALQVVSGLLRDAEAVQLLGDTAIAFDLRVAEGVVCARDPSGVVFPPAGTSLPLFAAVQPPEPGDVLRLGIRDSAGAVVAWSATRIDSVTTRSGGTACGPAGGWVEFADQALPSVRALAALDARVAEGAVARIGRPGRLALYNSGGDWMLGWRRCGNGTCGVIQPLAGPLRSPADGGLRVVDEGGRLSIRIGVPGIAGIMESTVGRSDAGR